MEELRQRAEEIAADEGMNLGSGHLFLAMIDGRGSAGRVSKLLKDFGVNAAKVRFNLRELGDEPSDVTMAVERSASRLASSFGLMRPYPLHYLVAMAGNKNSQAARTMEALEIDPKGLRNQALRRLTGTNDYVAVGGANAGALPMHDHLQELTAGRAVEPMPQPVDVAPERPPAFDGARSVQLMSLLDARRELEQKQRKTLEQRSGMGPVAAGDPAPAEQLELQKMAPASLPNTPESHGGMATRRTRLSGSVPNFDLLPSEYPLLSELGRNLTKEALMGDLDAIIGRQFEMERIADVLNKRRANSPCLVGPPGVGKTAIVEGLAQNLAMGAASGLQERILVELRPVDLLSGTSLRGALAERLSALREEVKSSGGRVVLFFDEIHALLGSADGAEAVAELKMALAKGELPCIAATTDDEYSRFIDADPALARRFTPIEIEEPKEEETYDILKGTLGAYSEHHGIQYADEAIKASVRMAARYVPDRALPDKAIGLLDLAGSRARREQKSQVGRLEVAAVLAEQIGVPAERLVASDRERLLSLESELSTQVIGHGHVMTAIGETLRRNAAGFRSGRPIGSFLFLGPTGVGKTETAKAVANVLFPGGSAVIRLDMSEFAESHAVARLIGAPPGYIGHEDGGQLTEAVRHRPYSLVLLDEIEKAHRDVIQLLLQVLDDGRLTDGRGRTVVFENTVIVMTSNLGSDVPHTVRRAVGFGAEQNTRDAHIASRSEAVIGSAKAAMPPELWNRIDEPLVFAPLTEDEVANIAILMLNQVSKQLVSEHEVRLSVGPGTVDTLIALGGYDPEFGARPMRRVVQRSVEGPMARMLLAGEITEGCHVEITGDENELNFAVIS